MADLEILARDIANVLDRFGCPCQPVKLIVGPQVYRILVRPAIGVPFAKIQKHAVDLRIQVGLTYEPIVSAQSGAVAIDVPRSDRQLCSVVDWIPLPQKTLPPTEPLTIPIGVTLDNQLYSVSLSDSATCHWLGAGASGSGKSTLLKLLAILPMLRFEPAHLKVVLCDPKRVTFARFRPLPWVWENKIYSSPEDIATVLEALLEENDRRYECFSVCGVENIQQYNQKVKPPMPRIVLIADEAASFLADESVRKRIEASSSRLSEMARAAGIHLIFFTHRATAKIIGDRLRTNFPFRIALRLPDIHNSAIILGGDKCGDAAYLLGHGDMIVRGEGGLMTRLQGLYLPDDALERFITRHAVETIPASELAKFHHACEVKQTQGTTAALQVFDPNASRGGNYWRRAAREFNQTAHRLGVELIRGERKTPRKAIAAITSWSF